LSPRFRLSLEGGCKQRVQSIDLKKEKKKTWGGAGLKVGSQATGKRGWGRGVRGLFKDFHRRGGGRCLKRRENRKRKNTQK